MPKALPATLKERIKAHLTLRAPVAEIAKIEGVGPTSVYRIRDNAWLFGDHTAQSAIQGRPGRPSALNDVAKGALRLFLESKPWAYQTEMQEYLLDECELAVDQSTISRTLKRMGISQKSLRREAAERDYDLRCDYMLSVSEFTANQLVYIDESAANEHTAFRKRGWSPLGIKASVRQPLKRSERHSILPAYCIDGILAHSIHQGGIDGDTLVWFLRELLLPLCNPYPGPKSVIILDNCGTHKTADVKRLCAAAGVVLLYLPPYSPDFNPIEKFFSVIKAWNSKKRNVRIVPQVCNKIITKDYFA